MSPAIQRKLSLICRYGPSDDYLSPTKIGIIRWVPSPNGVRGIFDDPAEGSRLIDCDLLTGEFHFEGAGYEERFEAFINFLSGEAYLLSGRPAVDQLEEWNKDVEDCLRIIAGLEDLKRTRHLRLVESE